MCLCQGNGAVPVPGVQMCLAPALVRVPGVGEGMDGHFVSLSAHLGEQRGSSCPEEAPRAGSAWLLLSPISHPAGGCRDNSSSSPLPFSLAGSNCS